MAIFPTFSFRQYRPGKRLYDILERKNAFLGYKNNRFKIWQFFELFYLGNIGQQDVFYDILERKKACLGYKNNKLRKSKN